MKEDKEINDRVEETVEEQKESAREIHRPSKKALVKMATAEKHNTTPACKASGFNIALLSQSSMRLSLP